MKINYICFEVSALCNMNCKFCFAKWRDNRKNLSYDEVIRIIDELKKNGLKAINLTGGDSLLHKDIIKICKYCKDQGLVTIISTNGIELMNKREILDYIDAINLPLDSYNPEIHNEYRPCRVKNHHELVLDLINYINNNYPNIKIKINTMVGKQNINDVVNIGDLIINKVYSWKLSKFLSSGYGKKYEDEFMISNQDFEMIVKKCEEKYRDANIVNQEYLVEKTDLFNIFIDNYGHINIHTEKGIEDVGDIKNLKGILNKYSKENFRKDYYDKAYDKE